MLIRSYVKLNQFPVSRCVFVLEEVQARAVTREVPTIAELAGRGAVHAQQTMHFDTSLQAARGTRFPPAAKELNHLVDHGVNGINSYCNTQIHLFRGKERGAAAERVKPVLLPKGVAFITAQPYADQHEQVNRLLERAAAPALQGDMAILVELPVLLERLRVVNDEYGAALFPTASAITRQELRNERARCQEFLAEVVALIFGHFALQPPERQADRDYLLEPILRQDEAIRARRRRRRRDGQDTDPVTDPLLPAPGDLGPAPSNDQEEPGESAA